MKVSVNDRCQGHARCIVFAPETFDIDDDGYAFVIPGRETVTAGDEAVQRAVTNCPEEAIVLGDDGV